MSIKQRSPYEIDKYRVNHFYIDRHTNVLRLEYRDVSFIKWIKKDQEVILAKIH